MAKQTGERDSPIRVARYLRGLDFPADKDQLLEHATVHQADDEVIETLARLPDVTYHSMDEVMKGYGQLH
ncbi:hypothetical protein CAI21_19660 [Alkalilimnicola ehrlichii]|uniref:DUF2795 domain-containing protein n=1 Tax=Alkalilimnicola ehrlichii TaxID=351052 RepID=A0A3E0WHL4_9GAMM|nr:DUF2795 domain-containing protein [Alkalilimnicola ehrlichii]RFA25189.1 hypothetical protein CAI21_19660 [Alkalilimnicola ehrlichii]RFA32268.1 hypothetical protein CAL65_20080 [Alkalilimnicola ehrlichii]